ncbi:hypothetical protein Tco_1074903, partial [Tanacetum coccineum]
MMTRENNIDHDFLPLDLTHDVPSTNKPFNQNHAPDSNDGSENRREIYEFLSSKAKAWMDKKGIALPWKRNENGGSYDGYEHVAIDLVRQLESGTSTSIFKYPALKQLAIKRGDEYGFVIRPGL